jgi:lipopolysaccharide export system permease protein
VGFAIVVYFVYSNLLSASEVWLEKGELPPQVGVWWVHIIMLGLGVFLMVRESSRAS